MFLKSLVVSAICSYVLCSYLANACDVNCQIVQKGLLAATPVKGQQITYANNTRSFRIPKDDLYSNYGDLVHLTWSAQDSVLFQHIYINKYERFEQTVLWTFRARGFQITYISILNLGRQRAYCNYISSSTSEAEALLTIPAKVECRMNIAVYGRPIIV